MSIKTGRTTARAVRSLFQAVAFTDRVSITHGRRMLRINPEPLGLEEAKRQVVKRKAQHPDIGRSQAGAPGMDLYAAHLPQISRAHGAHKPSLLLGFCRVAEVVAFWRKGRATEVAQELSRVPLLPMTCAGAASLY